MNNKNNLICLYWKDIKYNSYDSKRFSIPIANSWNVTEEYKKIVIEAIETVYNNGYVTSYHGDSYCRICDVNNGSSESKVEFGDVSFVIPSGYIHYLKKHNVKPDERLMKYIDGIINFDVTNEFHILEVISECNYNVSIQDLYKRIVEHYENFGAIFGCMRHIDKFAYKLHRKGFKPIDYFTIGTMIKQKEKMND